MFLYKNFIVVEVSVVDYIDLYLSDITFILVTKFVLTYI